MSRLLLFLLLASVVSAPRAASPLGEPLYRVQGAFDDVAVKRDLAFFAVREAESGEPDVRIYRLGRGGRAKLVGDYFNADGAYGLEVAGNYLYLANGDRGLEIIDISDPTHPREVALQPLKGFSHQVRLQRGHAFVASGFGGMHVVDVRRPRQPRLVATWQAYPSPMDAPPVAPVAEGLFPQGGEEPAASSGGYPDSYYDADDLPAYEGVEEEVPMSEIARKEGALDLTLGDGVAYLAYASAGIVILDISNPKTPVPLVTLPYDHPVDRVQVSGNDLYATAGIAGVQRLDVGTPSAPVTVAAYRTLCYPQGVAPVGERVYVADGYCGSDGLLTLDLRPGAGEPRTSSVAGTVGNVRSAGGRLFVMGLDEARVFALPGQ